MADIGKEHITLLKKSVKLTGNIVKFHVENVPKNYLLTQPK